MILLEQQPDLPRPWLSFMKHHSCIIQMQTEALVLFTDICLLPQRGAGEALSSWRKMGCSLIEASRGRTFKRRALKTVWSS